MTERLENLTIHPGMPDGAATGDLLSHVLAQIRLTGDRVFLRTLAAAEALDLGADEACIIVITDGALVITEGDALPVVIDSGELAMLPHGPGRLRLAAAERGASVVVCRFWFDPESLRGLILALPPFIRIDRTEGGGWIDGVVHFLMIEAGDVQPGAALMISRLIDLVIIRTLRSWVQHGRTTGWLGGLADARISRALKAIHEDPMRRWSIDALSGLAGMSRSSFCDRFTALVGRSPLRYQNEWRLGLARDMLARPDARVGEVGLRIGYRSEAAFSRAYKDIFGHSPRAELARGG